MDEKPKRRKHRRKVSKERKHKEKHYPFRGNILFSTVGKNPVKYYSLVYINQEKRRKKVKTLYLGSDKEKIKKRLIDILQYDISIEEIKKRIDRSDKKLFMKILLFIRDESLSDKRKQEETIIFLKDILKPENKDKKGERIKK